MFGIQDLDPPEIADLTCVRFPLVFPDTRSVPFERLSSQGVRIGMVVNDMAEVNVDAKLVRDDPNSQGAGADSVELQNGCICW